MRGVRGGGYPRRGGPAIALDVATETTEFPSPAADAAEAPATPPRGGLRGVLGIPAFRRLWLAQLTAQLGEAVALVAMPLLAYAMTGSAELLSLIFVLQLLPRIVLAPITGVLADRLDRRRLMIAADLVRAALVALLPFTREAWQIGLLALLVAIGSALARPAELAAVPMVVPVDQLVPALSATQVASSVVRVVGPALAGGIIALTGPGPAFGAQAACFVISAAILSGLTLPPVERAATETASALAAVRREISDGLRIVLRNPVVRGTAAVESLWQTAFATLIVTVLIYIEQTLQLGPDAASGYSSIMAAFAGGAALGALVARPVERRIGRPLLMAIGYLAPLMLIPAIFAPPLPVFFACWLILGFTDAWAVISMQSYLAEAVPDALRGRVYATWTGIVTLAGAIAFVLIGWLTPRLGPPQTLALTGAVVGIGGPLILLTTGALAAMRRLSAETTVSSVP